MSVLKHPQVDRLEQNVSNALKQQLSQEELFSIAPFAISVPQMPARTGSSEKYSKSRPPIGLRIRFMPGASQASTS